MAHKIQIKRGNKADLPVLNDGEMGLCIDTQEVFIGSNSTNIPVGVQTEIVNNLTETVTGKALDATQGKALAEQISSIPVYTHPTTAGNKHIPTGGTVGQIMTNSASGTAVWSDPVAGVTIVKWVNRNRCRQGFRCDTREGTYRTNQHCFGKCRCKSTISVTIINRHSNGKCKHGISYWQHHFNNNSTNRSIS